MHARSLVLAGLALLPLLTPAHAQDEEEPHRAQLYVCGVGPTSEEGLLELTGVENPDTDGFSDLQFRAEIPGEPTLLFPPEPGPGKGNFFFSNTDGPDGYLVSVRFTQADTKYRFYSVYVPPDPNDEYDAGGGDAGLVITEADGSSRTVHCGEVPYEFIVYMQESMSCDVDPRYDASFCDPYGEPQRVEGDELP